MTDTAARPAALVRALGLGDVVLMTVVAVVSLRWIPWAARAGAASITLWLLAAVAFFLPLAAALIALSRRYPAQGGLYAWTRRAFGPGHGFVCGWCLWVNNLFYFPSLMLFGAANALVVGGASWRGAADSHAYSIAYVLAGIWLAASVNIAGFKTGRWVQNIGTIGVWIPATLLMGAGALALVTTGPATSFRAAELLPSSEGGALGSIALWSAMCFAFSGFEITSLVGLEVRDPHRTVPRGVLLAGAAVTVIYVLGSAALLIAVPAGALHERSGITDAVDVVGSRLGLPALGWMTGGLLALAAFAGTFSWMAGAARVPFAAGVDGAMPSWLGRLHARYRTPHLALLAQGALSSAIFLASAFLTVTGTRTSIRDAYDVLVNLTILVYFVPYVYLFLAVPRLVGHATVPLRFAAGVGAAATMIAIGLLFVPPPGTRSVVNYEASLVMQSAAVIGAGLFFYRRRAPVMAAGEGGESSTPSGTGRG
ncbi:MAG TPA: APC family permease [Vicinamibacterales bacterium]|nr:APC family permease [Vicinamibacterales bacterium]